MITKNRIQMRNFLIISLTFISLVLSSSCEKEKTDDTNVIRPLVEFTTADIPTFNGMTQTKTIDNSFLSATKMIDDSYSAQYEFKWVSESDDFAYFDIRIMENHDRAITTLTEMHNYYSNPFVAESIDDPAKVGDISYMEGREFIRDNLIIRIHANDKFDDKITEIAKYIDSKLLKSQSFASISQVRPIINDFEIEKNPVLENTQTKLTIKTTDPNDKDIIYQWRFDSNSGYGGIKKDDSENYYYTSTWIDSENDTVGLTLIAINEYGFCTHSTLNIVTTNE
jgi:hypothetical protein